MVVKEAADSAISYATVGVCFILSHLIETAHVLTIVLGLLILIFRAGYDGVRLWRLLKGRSIE